MQFQTYLKYKPSGIDWLGEIPEGWEVKRIKDLFSLITDKAHIDNNFQLLSIYTSIGVEPREDMEQRGNKSVTTDGYWRVKKGDFIVNKLLAWMGAIALSNYEGVTSPAYDILRKKHVLCAEYYEYFFRARLAQLEFKKHSRGIMDVRLRLYFDKFGSISFPYQNITEQTAIADYLDQHTALIDKKIELLKAKKQSYTELKQTLINEVVTKGLDKTVEMKDSGIDWIGQIPKHWEVKRLKNLINIFTGNSIAEKDLFLIKENSYPYIATKDIDIETNQIDYDNGIYIPKSDKNFKIAKKDSVLLCIEGANAGKKIAQTEMDVCFVNKQCAMKSVNNKMVERFLFYFIQGSIFKSQFFLVLNGLIGGVSINLIKRIFLVIPPKSEQTAIANYLDEKNSKIDQIIKTIDSNIFALQEFRKTLINDVVTGKVKVL